ncbi:hypothetical protein GCM10010960_05280 [Arenimonas maotaiensis]|uniref:Glycosyltransferase n=1 Tax=Arenimonas maotaiensis TaxID=1446479 RepID=A0A917CH27_9GAMM|nr:glycosyltransferase [Arenimonas maotaiensis]GGF86203.1 hypothetical protein GCM10010960_05280 [Arenimonas maotaiensis]
MANRPISPTNRPKILWFAFKLFDKSVDKATWLEMINELSTNFEVRLLTLYRNAPIPLVAGGFPVDYVPRIGSGIIGKAVLRITALWSLFKAVLEFRPDAVIINGEPPYLLLKFIRLLQDKCRFVTVFDVRTLPVGDNQARGNSVLKKSLALAATQFSGITYITLEMERHCIAEFQLPEHKSAIWTSGVNAEKFTRYPIPEEETFRLIYHGGILSRSRGLLSLVQAMALVKDIPVQLHLVSSLREKEVMEELVRLDLYDRVILHETVPNSQIPEMINHCHAGIIPLPDFKGWNTSSPIKLFEYLSCGRPVIVTPIPAHTNVLKGSPFAFFSAGDDPLSLAASIREAYAERKRFPELSVLARNQAISFHTWKSQADVLGSFIATLIKVKKLQS